MIWRLKIQIFSDKTSAILSEFRFFRGWIRKETIRCRQSGRDDKTLFTPGRSPPPRPPAPPQPPTPLHAGPRLHGFILNRHQRGPPSTFMPSCGNASCIHTIRTSTLHLSSTSLHHAAPTRCRIDFSTVYLRVGLSVARGSRSSLSPGNHPPVALSAPRSAHPTSPHLFNLPARAFQSQPASRQPASQSHEPCSWPPFHTSQLPEYETTIMML